MNRYREYIIGNEESTREYDKTTYYIATTIKRTKREEMFKTAVHPANGGTPHTSTYIQVRESSKPDSSDMLSLHSSKGFPSTMSYRKRSYSFGEQNTVRSKRCSVDAYPVSEIQEVFEEYKCESKATSQTQRSTHSLKEAITDILVSADFDIFSDSNPCSSECGCCTVNQEEEEVILPIEISVEEAVMGDSYPVTVRYTSGNGGKWAVPTVQERATVNIVSSSDSENNLRCWKLSADNFVFGFIENDETYYIYVNTNNRNRLMLTSNGDDPIANQPSSSDKRVFISKYNSATGRKHLQPAFDSNLWIGIDDTGTKYAAAVNINISNAPGIEIVNK